MSTALVLATPESPPSDILGAQAPDALIPDVHQPEPEAYGQVLVLPLRPPAEAIPAVGDDQPTVSPAEQQRSRNFLGRRWAKLSSVFGAAKEDIRSSEETSNTVFAGLGCLAIKGAGRGNLPGWGMSIAAMDVLAVSNSPALTATAAFGMSALWTLTASRGVDRAVNHFPKAVGQAHQNFPRTTQLIADSLPGLAPSVVTPENNLERSRLHRRIGSGALLRLRRGLVAHKYLTRYVATAGVSGQSPVERRQLCRNLTLDASMVNAGLYGIISETIMTIQPHDAQLASQIQESVKNPLIQVAVSGTLMGATLLQNIFRHRAQNLSNKA